MIRNVKYKNLRENMYSKKNFYIMSNFRNNVTKGTCVQEMMQ